VVCEGVEWTAMAQNRVKLLDFVNVVDERGCIQKFPDWQPGARTANGTVLCH